LRKNCGDLRNPMEVNHPLSDEEYFTSLFVEVLFRGFPLKNAPSSYSQG